MHKHLVGDSGTEIVYRTKNIYNKEMRFIYFFADVPQTVRNFCFHSGSGRGTRYMWNNFFPAAGTGKFCLMMEKFFDCLNVRNTKEHITKRKSCLKPYESIDDVRFAWLDELLNYFKLWKNSIEERNDTNYSDNAKSTMFIPRQSYEGLQITVFSFKEVCKFLLQQGIPYILSERFCQDDLENYFGKQRAIGRRYDNSTVRDFGYNDNTTKS